MKYIAVFVVLLTSLVVGGNIALPGSASAAKDPACYSTILGIQPWYQYLEVGADGDDKCAFLPIPPDSDFEWTRALPRIGLGVVNILIRVSGLIAVGFTLYGGFRYMLSQGEPEATKKAKGTIVGASIGVVIVMFAAVLVNFIGSVLWK